MHLALLRPESLVIFQVQSFPKPLNGLGSIASPRTSLDLNFDFQTAFLPFLWQPSIIRFCFQFVKLFLKLSQRFLPRHNHTLNNTQIQGGKAFYPFQTATSTPSIHLFSSPISEPEFHPKNTGIKH